MCVAFGEVSLIPEPEGDGPKARGSDILDFVLVWGGRLQNFLFFWESLVERERFARCVGEVVAIGVGGGWVYLPGPGLGSEFLAWRKRCCLPKDCPLKSLVARS